MSNLLIAVDQRENARLLSNYLDQHYSVASLTSEDEFNLPFDLGIFDGHALNKFLSQVQQRKQREQSLFLPIVLITPRQDINMITRQLWRSIDEIIFAPIEKAELVVRVEVLLRARQLSLDLQSKNIHLQNEIISHQETEQALRESEDRFRVALKDSPIVVARLDRDLRYTWVYNPHTFQTANILGKLDDELIGADNARELMALKRSVLETGITKRQEIELNMLGTYKIYDMTIEPIIEDHVITGLRTAAFDITQRKQAEHRILKLYNLVLELSKALTLEDVAKTIIQYGMAALGATAGTIMLLKDDHETLYTLQSIGYSNHMIEAWQTFAIELSKASLAVTEENKTPLLYNSVEEQLGPLLPKQHMPIDDQHKAWAFLPFAIEDSMIGGFGFSFPISKTFDETERGFMLTVSHQCVQAIERVKLSEQLRQAAVLAERHRLSRDLHDAVSQALFAATAIADSVPLMWEKKPEKARELLKQVTSLNRGALAEMRTLLFELRPESLIKTNLKALLIQLLDAIKARKMIETILTVTGEPISILEDVHLALYRITQESLNNVVKHSQATQAHVILNYSPGKVTLQIIDNGRGFHHGQTTGGLGLGGMHERAEEAHLNLHIDSSPEEGTCVDVSWNISGKHPTPKGGGF